MNANTIKGASRRIVATLVALLATALTLLALASPARADTVWVNNNIDPGDGICNQLGCTLREAISAAAPGDTVKFAPSVPGTILLRDGHLEIDKNLTILGPGADKLTVSGNKKSRAFTILQGATVSVSGLTVSDSNSFTGGAVYNAGILTLRRVALTNNTAANGAGLQNNGSDTNKAVAKIFESSITGNKAGNNSGGIDNSRADVEVINSTVSGNEAGVSPDSSGRGGGIYNKVGSNLKLTNSTLQGNKGPKGANIWNDSDTELKNTIIANPSGGGDNCDAWRLITDSTYVSTGNNLDSDGSCRLSQSSDVNNKDPRLGPLAANGGSTKTHKLLSGSPAIDKGSNCPAKDQRGTTRPQDGDRNGSYKCDIGSFELEGPPPDTAKPIINGLSPKPGASTRDRTPTISATIRDNATDLQKSNIKLYVDGKLKTAFSYDRNTDRLSYTTGRLANKRHSVRIVATDDANNTSARTWRFTVDAVKPSIGRLSPRPGAKTFDRTPIIRATVKDNATNLRKGNIKLYVDGRRKTNFRYNARRDKLVYKSSRLSYKRHAVKIVAKDAAGNVAKRSWRFTVKKR